VSSVLIICLRILRNDLLLLLLTNYFMWSFYLCRSSSPSLYLLSDFLCIWDTR
jgi:hypothetical protein